MKKEVHTASIELEQALMSISGRKRGELGYDSDLIDDEEGLRRALAAGIKELATENKKLAELIKKSTA